LSVVERVCRERLTDRRELPESLPGHRVCLVKAAVCLAEDELQELRTVCLNGVKLNARHGEVRV
jgi:hypothetical protein